LDILKDKSRMFPTEEELCALFEEELWISHILIKD
jgi:hypothetical protein